MKLTMDKWFHAGEWVGMCLIAMSLASMSRAQTVTTTTVQGTVYQANGTPSAGTLQLSWPAFTTASNQAITAGRTTVSIGADGFVSVNLAPNLGSSPAGLFYTAVYHLSDGTTSTEYWVVPAAAQASLAQVRAQVMPAAQAVQAVNKAYVDQAIQLFAQTSLSPSGGTLSGPLYLSADPSQALQAADKHYVDSTFSQAVPLTGASLTGPLTSVQLGAAYQVDQFSGTDFGAKLQACVAGVSPVYGGTCDARNFTGSLSMASNLTVSTANTTILLPCATLSTAHQIIVAAGTRNVSLRGCALRGASNASGSQGGTVFLYSGTGAMVQVGDPNYAVDTLGFHLDNAVINTTAANVSATQALAAYRTQEMDLQSLYLLGNSNQTGITLDGTGNYSGGTFYDIAINGFQTAVNAIGHQVSNSATTDWLNASTFVRLHIDCPTSGGNPISGTYGINLQQGDGNTFTGGDVEGCGTALHLGSSAQNNTIVGLRNENSNNQVVADAGSSYNSWITGGTMFTGKLTDNGTRNSFLDTFHRSFNGMNGDWYGSQQDATVTNHFRVGVGTGNERGLLDRYQTDSGYRWTTGLSDATAGEQFYQILDELNNVYRLSIGQYNSGQPSTNDQTVINAAGTGAVVLNGSNNSGTGGVVIGSGGQSVATVATINNAGNAQFNGTLQVGGPATFTASTTVRNQADAEIDSILTAGATTNQKESFTYKDYTGSSQWYMLKDASNNWALNSAIGGLDSFKAYQSNNSGDTYINASNPSGVVRVNYETGAGTGFNIYGGSSGSLYASFTGAASIKLPGLAAGSGHNCLQIDNSGYVTNTGSACGSGSGSGSGTVNSGATGQIAYYSGTGTALSGMNTIPVSAGGTGASSAAGALNSLGGASLTSVSPQSFAGPVNGPAVNASVNTQINVMAPPYSAKGDCVTDDHDAILAAMTAAAAFNPPAVVYFPKPSGGCYLTSTLAWNGASLQGQPGLGTTYNTAGVSIQGKPGKDVFEVPSPSTVTTAAPNRTWSLRDLRIVVDDSTAGTFPHRWPGRWVSDAAMTAGSAVFTSSNSMMTCGDIGQAILVKGAGVTGTDLSTTVSNVTPCWANSLSPTSQVITLAAAAATSVSADSAYVSVAGLPVTAGIGACGIAFDDLDGNQADFTMNGKVGNLYDTLRDVSFNSVAGGYGKNASCGLYFQGWWGPYGLDARNVNIGGVYYGVVEGSSDMNPSYATGGNDFQKWDHGIWNATYPWISYNGAANKLEDIQIQSLNGPQILQFGNIWNDAAGDWYINMPEFAHVSGAMVGWRIEGAAHTLVNTLLGEDSTYTQPTYFDANDSQCINCSMMGAMTINGSHNRFSLTSDLASEHIIDNSLSNVVTGSYLSSPAYGYPVSRFYAVNNTRGDRAAGTITDDFLKSGNVATPYMSNLDLFFWPDEFVMNGAFNAPSVSTDSNSLTGRYLSWYQNLIVNKFTNAAYLNNGGTALIGSKMVPATQVTVYISAACPAITSYTFSMYAGNTSIASNTFTCSTSYATQSLAVDLTGYAGQALGFKISGIGSSGALSGANVAYIAVNPYSAALSMAGPINFGSSSAAAATLMNLGGAAVVSPLAFGAKCDAAWVNSTNTYTGTDDRRAFLSMLTYMQTSGQTVVQLPAGKNCRVDPPGGMITSFAINGNVVVMQMNNSLAAGDIVTPQNLSTGTYLNGVPLVVLSAGLSSTQFEATFYHANVTSTMDSGYGSSPALEIAQSGLVFNGNGGSEAQSATSVASISAGAHGSTASVGPFVQWSYDKSVNITSWSRDGAGNLTITFAPLPGGLVFDAGRSIIVSNTGTVDSTYLSVATATSTQITITGVSGSAASGAGGLLHEPWTNASWDGIQGSEWNDITLANYNRVNQVGCTATGLGQYCSYVPWTYGFLDYHGGSQILNNVAVKGVQYGFFGIQSDFTHLNNMTFNDGSVGVYIGPASTPFYVDGYDDTGDDTSVWLDGVGSQGVHISHSHLRSGSNLYSQVTVANKQYDVTACCGGGLASDAIVLQDDNFEYGACYSTAVPASFISVDKDASAHTASDSIHIIRPSVINSAKGNSCNIPDLVDVGSAGAGGSDIPTITIDDPSASTATLTNFVNNLGTQTPSALVINANAAVKSAVTYLANSGSGIGKSISLDSYAPLSSPSFTGTVTTPAHVIPYSATTNTQLAQWGCSNGVTTATGCIYLQNGGASPYTTTLYAGLPSSATASFGMSGITLNNALGAYFSTTGQTGDPGSYAAGQEWFNTTAARRRFYDGAAVRSYAWLSDLNCSAAPAGTPSSTTLLNGACAWMSLHGTSATYAQGSDGTGTNGNLPKFAADGSLTNGPASPAGAIVGSTDTQTLTNKTLTSPSLTTPKIGGTTISNVPIMTWSNNANGYSSQYIGPVAAYFTPVSAVTIRRFQMYYITTGVGCTTAPVIAVYDSTTSTPVASFTISNGTGIFDSGAISVNIAAGDVLQVRYTTAAAGCTTLPSNDTFTVQYQMQ